MLIDFILDLDLPAALKWPSLPHLMVVAAGACGSWVRLSAATSLCAFNTSRVVPAFLQFCAPALAVVAQLIQCSIWLILGHGELSRGPFGNLFCLNELFDFLEGEAVLEVVVGGVFLHDVFGYGSLFQSLHQVCKAMPDALWLCGFRQLSMYLSHLAMNRL